MISLTNFYSSPLKRQTKIVADDILFILSSFKENKVWFFMWILAEDSLETSSLIFSEMSSTAMVIGALRVKF